jgi:hypothetical protein
MVLAPLQLPQIWKRRPAGEARLRPDEALTFSRHDKETAFIIPICMFCMR